jgi:hypothetical protein
MPSSSPADNSPPGAAAAREDGREERLNDRTDDMALSRSSSWKEHRLADRLDCDGRTYSVDLVARKATGVEGWKMTVVFLPRGEGDEVKVELPNAASTADVRRRVTELEGNAEALRGLFAQAGK